MIDRIAPEVGLGSLDVDGQRGAGSAQRPSAQLPEFDLGRKSIASWVPGYDLEEGPIPLPPGFELVLRADRPGRKGVGRHGPREFSSRKQPNFISPCRRCLACSSAVNICARLSGYKRDGSATESVNWDAGHISWDSKPKTATIGVVRLTAGIAAPESASRGFGVDGALTVCADRPTFRPSDHVRGLIRVRSHCPAPDRTPKEMEKREETASARHAGRPAVPSSSLSRYASSGKVKFRRIG
jgi:hypothetical protein